MNSAIATTIGRLILGCFSTQPFRRVLGFGRGSISVLFISDGCPVKRTISTAKGDLNMGKAKRIENKEVPVQEQRVICQGDWVIDKENDVSIECYVTEDKGRFLSLKGAARALGLKGAGSTALARNLDRLWIRPYLSQGLIEWLQRISSDSENERLAGLRGRKIVPLEAALFVDICKAYVTAQRDGLFTDEYGSVTSKWENQNDIADKLFMIMTAFAKVGIVALIDEITGYQEQRERDELSTLLSRYLADERLAWARMFPDEFYKQIYKLKKWPYPTGTGRTPYIGKLTNQLVYEKLPHGVLDELKRRNPVIPGGGIRRWKHHQFLSADLGQPDLRDHLLQVIAIMKASPNWNIFERLFARAFPEPGELKQLEMEDTIDV